MENRIVQHESQKLSDGLSMTEAREDNWEGPQEGAVFPSFCAKSKKAYKGITPEDYSQLKLKRCTTARSKYDLPLPASLIRE